MINNVALVSGAQHSDPVTHIHVSVLSHVGLFCDPNTAAHQAPLSMEFFQTRILEWVAISSSRASSQPRDQNSVWCLLPWQVDSLPLHHLGSPYMYLFFKFFSPLLHNIEQSFLCHTVGDFHMVLRHDSDIKGIHLC